MYSPDISCEALSLPKNAPFSSSVYKAKDCLDFKKMLTREILDGTNVGPPLLENDPEISILFCYSDIQFRSTFNTAIEAYERGEWRMSKEFLERSLKVMPKDGPATNIYKYIKSYQFQAPKEWKGVRILTDK